MPYALRDDISFCWVEGHPFFLDIRNDRYFRLQSPVERAFIACSQGEYTQLDLSELVERNILIKAPAGTAHVSAVSVERPCRSAFEESVPHRRIRVAVLLEAFAAVYLTCLWKRMHALKDVLSALDRYRNRRAPPQAVPTTGNGQQLAMAATEFRTARLYVPVETTCLLDSLAMVRFLARRGLHANLVFGVACDPFSAHCWVQAGDRVLNDTVGNVNAHTPIRVV